MNKKLIGVGIGIVLLASPLIASAQTASSNQTSIIAELEQLVATLTQELQQLLALHQKPTTTIQVSTTNTTNSDFNVAPVSGNAPLAVTVTLASDFDSINLDEMNFGDNSATTTLEQYCVNQANCTAMNPVPHTYQSPGTYNIELISPGNDCYGGVVCTQEVLATQTITVTGNNSVQPSVTSFCSNYGSLVKGSADASTNGQVSQLQSFLGISPTTGYYGAQTSIAYQNKCGNLGNSQPTSVPGMSQYTDSNFGFSFWYPSSWTLNFAIFQPIVTNPPTKVLTLTNQSGATVEIQEEYADYPNGSGQNTGIQNSDYGVNYNQEYYFDVNTAQWMMRQTTPTLGIPQPADVSMNSMGGLHILSWSGLGDLTVPLSATKFVTVSGNTVEPLAQTIVATNPAVAVPVSTSQQIATIQAEASAYGFNSSSQSLASAAIDQSFLTINGCSLLYAIKGTATGTRQLLIKVSRGGATVSTTTPVYANSQWGILSSFLDMLPAGSPVSFMVYDAATNSLLTTGTTTQSSNYSPASCN